MMVNGRQASRSKAAVPAMPRRPWHIVCRTGVIAAAVVLLTGCGNIEPWVKPYERDALADPIMSFDSHPVSTNYIHHVYEAREGARGALGGSGGGCGCL